MHERVADEFVAKVVAKAKNVRAGSDEDAQYGPITMPSQLSVIRGHIEDALKRGGKALVGGVESVGDRYVQPTVLVDVPEDSEAVREETFGPTVTIARVRQRFTAPLTLTSFSRKESTDALVAKLVTVLHGKR